MPVIDFTDILSWKVFYLYHGFISLLLGIISAYFLQKRFETHKIIMIIFIFMFNMSLPVFGYVMTIGLVYYLLTVTYEKELNDINMINMSEFETEFPQVQRIFAEGSMQHVILDDNVNGSLKMKALVSLADNASREDLQLVKSGLTSKNDEIRLYSFAIIDKKERIINEKIHQQMQIFNKEESLEYKLKSAEMLIFLYWEMVYFELSDEDLKHFLLLEIQKYAEFVLKSDPYHTKVHVTLGKMFLMEHKFDKSEEHFIIAIEKGVDKDFILPYLAEVYYHQHKFHAVKQIFQQSERLYLNTMLYPIVEQWSSPWDS